MRGSFMSDSMLNFPKLIDDFNDARRLKRLRFCLGAPRELMVAQLLLFSLDA